MSFPIPDFGAASANAMPACARFDEQLDSWTTHDASALGELDLSAAKRKLLFQLICGKVTTAIDANTGAASKLGSVAGEG